MQLLYSLATNLRLNEFYQHKCWRKVKFKAARMSYHGNRILNLHMRVFVSKVLCRARPMRERGTPPCHTRPIATRKHGLNFKYHLLTANLRVRRGEKKECEKTCLELPSAREYSTISRDGVHWIHYSLWIIRPDLTAIVQWAFKYWDEEPLQT